MKLDEFRQMINSPILDGELDVVLDITLPFSTAGGSPCEAVATVRSGFDWDNGKLFIKTENPVGPINDKINDLTKKLFDRVGWLEYENRGMKAELKKLRATKEST